MIPDLLILDPAKLALWLAADYIEEHGHCQNGHGSDDSGRRCVAVAIFGLSLGTTTTFIAERLLEENIPEVNGPHSKIANWSDSTPTLEVIAKLREVALS